MTATEAVAALRAGQVKPSELVDAAARRIEAVEPGLNALPILDLDRAREAAKRREDAGVRPSGHPADLAGLPIAIKDLIDVAGLPTTYGCPLFKDNVARTSDPLVRLLESRGAIVVAKSNSPEFGMLPQHWWNQRGGLEPAHSSTSAPPRSVFAKGGTPTVGVTKQSNSSRRA
ncbi:MAG: amidase family protein, partial [Alphaproteobacteria bacterium]